MRLMPISSLCIVMSPQKCIVLEKDFLVFTQRLIFAYSSDGYAFAKRCRMATAL